MPGVAAAARSVRLRFVIQPASTSAEYLQWYEFIGVLMGIALLSKETSLMKIEHIENEGVDEELFSDLIFEVFTAQLSNGVEARAT
ncbi:MAG: hypothetical protein SGPRY_000438 [Prymnesium sp.]